MLCHPSAKNIFPSLKQQKKQIYEEIANLVLSKAIIRNNQITGTFESAVITGGFSLKHASSHVCKVASNTFWLSCSR